MEYPACWHGTDVDIKILLKKLFGIFKCHINILILKKVTSENLYKKKKKKEIKYKKP